jgi:hypothetical protein
MRLHPAAATAGGALAVAASLAATEEEQVRTREAVLKALADETNPDKTGWLRIHDFMAGSPPCHTSLLASTFGESSAHVMTPNNDCYAWPSQVPVSGREPLRSAAILCSSPLR